MSRTRAYIWNDADQQAEERLLRYARLRDLEVVAKPDHIGAVVDGLRARTGDLVVVDRASSLGSDPVEAGEVVQQVVEAGGAIVGVLDGSDSRTPRGRSNLFRTLALGLPATAASIPDFVTVIAGRDPDKRQMQRDLLADHLGVLGVEAVREVEFERRLDVGTNATALLDAAAGHALLVARLEVLSPHPLALMRLWRDLHAHGAHLASLWENVQSWTPGGLAHFASAVGVLASRGLLDFALSPIELTIVRAFRTTSSDALARQLGVSKPTVYKHLGAVTDRVVTAVDASRITVEAITTAHRIDPSDMEFVLAWHRQRGSGRRLRRQSRKEARS